MSLRLVTSDADVRTAVTDELRWSPDVGDSDVGVAVADGAVTLSGEVGSHPEKTAAVRAAERVDGVRALADEITVRECWGPVHDTDTARQASQTLEWAVNVPASVHATVHDHEITLTGTVEWHYQRIAAELAVAQAEGVRSITNLVAVAPHLGPDGLRAALDAALARGADPDEPPVRVTVDGSTVRLTGTVRTWGERRRIEDLAWSAPGVAEVDDQLVVLR